MSLWHKRAGVSNIINLEWTSREENLPDIQVDDGGVAKLALVAVVVALEVDG